MFSTSVLEPLLGVATASGHLWAEGLDLILRFWLFCFVAVPGTKHPEA